jgi:hypothetical protein
MTHIGLTSGVSSSLSAAHGNHKDTVNAMIISAPMVNFHHILWCEKVERTVNMRFELHPFFLDFLLAEGVHLVPTRIRQNITIPIHEFMQTTGFLQDHLWA